MDPLEFGSLARIRILLLPVGNIKRSFFEQWAAEVRTFESIRLGDIPADTRDDRARFMPSPLASGHIHLSYPSHPLPSSHQTLSLFRPSDFPLGVIGIASSSSSQNESMSSILAQFNAMLSDLFPPGALFPLANNCLVFEESDGSTNLNLGNYPGLVVIPGMMGNKRLYVGTLIADLCSNILAEFATVVQSLESPLGNEYLNATLFPTLPPVSEMPKPIENEPPVRSSLPPLPSQHSQPELLRVRTPTTLSVKRNSSIGPGPPSSPFRQSSLPAPTKKKPLTIGAVSSHGRLFKVLADFFLLAGRTMDASVWYSEAIILLKSSQDSVWHASALEGLATMQVVDAWSSNQMNGTPEGTEPWTEVIEKVVQAAVLYCRSAPPAEPEANFSFVSWFYTRSILRHASLLLAVWASKGWGPMTFAMLLHGSTATLPPTLSQESESTSNGSKRVSYNSAERLSSITGITRSAISSVVAQAHGPWLLHLGSRERIFILENVAAIYSILGYLRKEAYILREVLGCIMDLVVCGREESGGPMVAGAGLGIQGVDLGDSANRGSVGIRTVENVKGNESILRVVKHICRVHGIDLEAVRLVASETAESGEAVNDGSEEPETVEEAHGWPELQIGIVREAIAVAEALPDYPAVAQFCLSSLKTLHVVMSHGDQHHFYSTAARALSTARRRGDSRRVDYWSGKPIVSIEILPLPLVRLPIEKPISLLSQKQEGINPILVGKTDPFLYNPRRSLAGQSSTLLVQNEPFDVVITLRNPYIFDLELSKLSLSTAGVAIESKPMALVVPANSFHPVTIAAQALEAGTLTIRGCCVQAPGGATREFLLPLSTDDEESRQARRRSAIDCETGRSKHAGLDSRPFSKKRKRSSATATSTAQHTPKFLQCQVVLEQPLLRIRRTSLTHGAVMLYNGEKSTIRITLENVSSLPVDFVRLTFDDSTIAPAQQALAEGDLSVYDTYETEFDLIHKPVFTWESSSGKHAAEPGEKLVVTVDCFGKVGCTHGIIHVSYSYCHRPRPTLDKPPDTFHTRQLSYPVLVTVYQMLECFNLDILPYSPDTAFLSPEEHRAPLLIGDVDDWCIFSVEVRNTYGIPFEVTFERDQPDASAGQTTTLVPPGSTSRILLPIKKFALPDDEIRQPIPTLSDRQFVVSKSGLSAEQEQLQRELFWYREALLGYVRGKWKETGGTRTGELSLRQLRITQPMLNSTRVEQARLHLALWCHEESTDELKPIPTRAGVYQPPLNELVYLRTKVTNLSKTPRTFTVNFVLDPPQHILFEGVLSDIPVGRLASDEAYEFDTPVTFVACGRFELTAFITDPSSVADRDRLGRSLVKAAVQP
ncbi:TRAPP II complex [Phanerochaete sordida]|uniref:TRAPP II complex n=1 Tax=Phanerochaete sordida TaxID=48140 RepID=A0A9P3G7M6_9APHY|nr:TRAPP II complex [Phanerochaete sordida]